MAPAGCQWAPESPKTLIFPRQDGGKPEVTLGRGTSQLVANRSQKHKKPSFCLQKRKVLWPGGPFFGIFHSLTRSSTQMRPSKQLLVLKKLMYSLDRCSHDHRWSLNVELLAMSNYLQCRTACNVELLAMSNYLQCRTTCSVELLAMSN